NLSISNDYAYGNYNHPSDDGDDDALAVRLAVDSMQIFCKMLTGKTMSIHVPSTATIFEVKRMIRRTEHIAVAEQTLIFAGRLLENDRTIGHYNIQKESTIHLIMDLRGGMYHETSGRNGAYGPLKSCVFNIKVDM
ncbi:MAG: ubiquitin family protein, partial [Harvfovirus sp.]